MAFGKSKIFLLLCLSFVIGVFAGKYLELIDQRATIMAIAAMIFLMFATVGWGRKAWMVIGFAGLILLVGAWRWQTSFDITRAENFVGQYYGQEVELEGVVVREPDVRSNKINLTVKSRFDLSRPSGTLPTPGEGREIEGNILLNVGRYPEYEYGDRIRFRGKLEEPFVSEEFSYKDYLSRFETYAVIRFPKVEKVASRQGNAVKAGLLAIKHKFQEVLSRVLPEPHNAFLLGLILGLKRAIPEGLKEAFVITGVSHIVVISGYNISIITNNILRTRAWWGRRAAFVLSLLTVLAFVVLTGAEASVIRAAVMGMLLVLALNLGRLYAVQNALVLTGAVMVAISPKILAFDIGFQLSFLATAGLIYLSPVFEKWLRRLPNFLGFRTNLSATLSAQIFTLPLLIFYFDRISLIAPLTNVLVLWAIPYTMFFGFFAGLFGIVYLPLGQILASLPWVLLQYMITVVEWFARLPLSATAARINLWWLLAYYLIMVLWLTVYRRKKNFRYYLEYVETKI